VIPALLEYMVIFILVFLAIAFAMIPYLTPPYIQFGIRLPQSLVDSEGVIDIRRKYRNYSVLLSAIIIALFVILLPYVAVVMISTVPLLVVLAVFFLYYWFHRKVADLKRSVQDEHQYPAASTAVIGDIQENVNRLWLLVPWFEILIFFAVGILYYPSIPQTFPTHFTVSGTPDQYATKSVLSVFGILFFAGVPVAVLIETISVLSLRVAPFQNSRSPRKTAKQMAAFNSIIFYALLGILLVIELSLFLSISVTWGMLPSSYGFVSILPVIFVLPFILAISFKTGQTGWKLFPQAIETPSEKSSPDDDRFWKAGVLYYNREDRSLIVPKRFGVGYTFNFAHPVSWVVLALPLIVFAIVFLMVSKVV
jgi:uncharacterized membrane protein